MTNQQMISAILQQIQTSAQLTLLLQTMIANNIGNVSTPQLQAMCQVLGINFQQAPTS